MRQLFFIISLFTLATIQWQCTQDVWSVEKFGAVADGVTVNTEAIQQTIDACHEAGGGVVVLESGVYLSGTILLKDNVTLEVRSEATLRGTTNPLDYICVDEFVDATGQRRGECLVGARDAKNIGIIGNGTIDGDGEHFKVNLTRKRLQELGATQEQIKQSSGTRPFLLRFVRSEAVTLNNINLRQPAAWTCHFFQCKDIVVKGVSIYAHDNQNNDGIDLDSCTGANITDCDIDTGDDAMCFKTTSPMPCQDVYVANCKLKSHWGAIKFGTESMGDFRNIKVENCEVYDTQGGGIKVLSVDGANIENVRIDNINMTNVDMPIFVRLGERLRTYRDAKEQTVGSISGLYLTNITATTRSCEESRVNPPSGIFITGTPNTKIKHVQLSNIEVKLPGGGSAEDSEIVVAEDEKRYPEFSFFGTLPAYGLNARHIELLEIEDVSFQLTGEDQRETYKISDVNQVTQYPSLKE
ncbi:MAG: glycoside hydrolase family 28 protein [Rikenellaceae bacterium]